MMVKNSLTPIPPMKMAPLRQQSTFAALTGTIREIEPSPGYLLDETVHEVGADAGNFTIEHNTIPVGRRRRCNQGRYCHHQAYGRWQHSDRDAGGRGRIPDLPESPQAATMPPIRMSGIS